MAFTLRLDAEQQAALAAAAARTGQSAVGIVRTALDDWLQRTAGLDPHTAALYHQGDPAVGPRLAAEHRIREVAGELATAVTKADEDRRYSLTPAEFPAEAADEVRQLVGRLEALLPETPEDPRLATLVPALAKVVAGVVAVFGEPPAPPAAPTMTKAVTVRKRSAAEVERAGIEAYAADARQRAFLLRVAGSTAEADWWEGVAEKVAAKLAKP